MRSGCPQVRTGTGIAGPSCCLPPSVSHRWARSLSSRREEPAGSAWHSTCPGNNPTLTGSQHPRVRLFKSQGGCGGDTESKALPRHVSSTTSTPRDPLWGRPRSAIESNTGRFPTPLYPQHHFGSCTGVRSDVVINRDCASHAQCLLSVTSTGSLPEQARRPHSAGDTGTDGTAGPGLWRGFWNQAQPEPVLGEAHRRRTMTRGVGGRGGLSGGH